MRLFGKSFLILFPALLPMLGFGLNQYIERKDDYRNLLVQQAKAASVSSAIGLRELLSFSRHEFLELAETVAWCASTPANTDIAEHHFIQKHYFSHLAWLDPQGQFTGSLISPPKPSLSIPGDLMAKALDVTANWLVSRHAGQPDLLSQPPVISALAPEPDDKASMMLLTPRLDCDFQLKGYLAGLVDSQLLEEALTPLRETDSTSRLIYDSGTELHDLLAPDSKIPADISALLKSDNSEGNVWLINSLDDPNNPSQLNHLKLAARLPVEKQQAFENKLAWEFGAWFLGAVLLLAITIELYKNYLSRGVNKAMMIIHRIAKGEYSARFINDMSDERAIFPRALNVMAARLESKHQSLQKSLALLKATLESTNDGILVLSELGEVQLANRRFFEIWGLPHSNHPDNPGGSIPQLLQDADQLSKINKQIEADPTQSIHAQLKLKDGRTIQYNSYPFEIVGRPSGRLMRYQDISNSAQLLDQWQFSNALINASHDPLYCVDTEKGFSISFVNEAACRHFQMPCERILGKTLELWDTEMSSERLLAILPRLRKTKKPMIFETAHRINPNQVIMVEMSISAIQYQGHEYLAGYIHDISQRKTVEIKQQKLQMELQQKHKMEALGQLTGGIAHDFNNILGIILGYTSLAQETSMQLGQEKMTDYLEQVTHAAERAKNLVSQMLAFTRRQPGRVDNVQLENKVRENIKLLAPSLPSTIQIEMSFDDNLPEVRLDPTQFQQIMMNLAINAKDAMNGKGCLGIRAHLTSEHGLRYSIDHHPIYGDWVELAISDTGVGIAADVIEHIFNPFFTTKDVGKGTGMGLAVVHGIMNNLGGHILVSSLPGHGSTFSLLFKPQTQETESAQQENTNAKRIAPKGSGQRILVIDDEPFLASYLGELLSNAGYVPTVMTDSMKACELLLDNPGNFDLLITDQTMPGISGMDIIRKIREQIHGFPAILCTGYSESIDEASAKLVSVTLMKKPVSAEDLLSKTAEMLSGKISPPG